ncbi:hypothetical protein AQJ46_45910 [Streptomyces canus]|uniref:NAD(P)-binding domain-containing protein n=1 Tax=Streptomyces canus TaxID=58343 RepID=A0A101RLD1_9ACTN|nr:hypothetical protein AQJ46_45910 [Streptomyces canus]
MVSGQATDAGDVARAMAGVDAVISTLGATGVTRFLELSSFAVLRERLSGPAKLMSSTAMGAIVKDKAAAENALRAIDLDYTLVHSVRLTNGPATGAAKPLPESAILRMRDTISRADVATWMLSRSPTPPPAAAHSS